MSPIRVTLCCLLLACAISAFALVSVTDLPGGEREVTVSDGFAGSVLHLSASGEVMSWMDSAGNAQVASTGADWTGKSYALELLDAKTRARLLPSDKATLAIAGETVTVTEPGGVKLLLHPGYDTLDIAVAGPGAYLLRGRAVCRQEGCAVLAPGGAKDATAGLGTIPGSPQRLVDALRTRALEITAPNALTWTLAQTDGWAWMREGIAWETAVDGAVHVKLAAVTTPRRTGPVQVGLYARRIFSPSGGPLNVATLSDTRLDVKSPVALSLAQPAAGTRLCAALLPMTPDDPIETTEQTAWYGRFDQAAHRMIPVILRAQGNGWSLAPRDGQQPGVYRLRLWLVPEATPLPEALGGPEKAIIGYFPGFTGRGTAITQSAPMGDVLVTVAPAAAGSITICNPSLRSAFWRGEKVALLVQVRAATVVKGTLTVRTTDKEAQTVVSRTVKLPVTNAQGTTELQLDTRTLEPGAYTVSVSVPGLTAYDYTFTIAPPREAGMADIASPMHGPADLDAFARVGTNVWTDIMPSTDGYHPAWPLFAQPGRGMLAADTALPALFGPGMGGVDAGVSDDLVRGNWLTLQGIQSRQISFGLHYDTPELVQETLRKDLLYAQFGRRLPSTLGTIFDYDLAGTGPGLGYAQPYINAGKRRQEWLAKQWEAAWALAKQQGATEAEKPRLSALFNAGIIQGMYRDSIAGLHAAVPEQRHSSSVTPDHNYIQNGQYLPAIYQPLDFRYLEVWNDQIYVDSAHDMMESFWAALLRMEKPAGQPVWITVPTAPQPGTHLRRTLEALSHGANSTGYNAEGSAGLTGGGWGADPLHPDARSAQEQLTGELATRYGAWLNAFQPRVQVAILYSVSQGGTNYGLSSPIFFAFYTLTQLNRPARLLTEDEIARGALGEVRALLLVGQTQPLPETTRAAIAAFAAHGGKVLCDMNTKVEISGAEKLPDVGWPGGLWPNSGNSFHAIIDGYPAKFGPSLKTALGDIGAQPLECADRTALIASTQAGAATLVYVTNNQAYPFEQLFTEEQRQSSFFRSFKLYGGIFYKDVRVPCTVNLTLRADLAAQPPHIYDVFAGKELPIVHGAVTVDLTTLSGRVLLLTATPPAPPTVSIAQADACTTLVVKSPVPLPVCIIVNGGQTVYRAATPQGSCDTFAVSGAGAVRIIDLLANRMWRADLPPAPVVKPAVRELPAVQVWDTAQIQRVLTAKNLAIYVDARQTGALAAAQQLAKALKAEVLFNPPLLDYPLSWDRTPEKTQATEKIRTESQLAVRRDDEPNFQWTGALQPAVVLNRPVILFGHAGNNRLIADLDHVTLLNRPAAPEYLGAGRAVVQPVATPFWQSCDAVVALCADDAGFRAAVAQLTALAAGRPVKDACSSTDDGGARAERRQALGLEPPVYPKRLTALKMTDFTREQGGLTGLTPRVPVVGLAPVGNGYLAILHSPGYNLVKVEGGKVAWRGVTGGYYQPEALFANAAGELVTSDGTFTWRHAVDGKVLWKMLGAPLRAPEADGSAWVRVDQVLKQVAADGRIVKTLTLPGSLLALSPDLATAYVQRPGGAGATRSDAALVAVELATGKERWSVPNLNVAEAALSADGRTLGCIEHEDMATRDDLERNDASRLTALDTATGQVRFRHPLGQSMANLCITPDGARLVATGAGFSNVIYVADVAKNLLRRTTLPDAGIAAAALAADGSALWVAAGDACYSINLDTLVITPSGCGAVTALVPTNGGGVLAGMADGRVLPPGVDNLRALNLLPGLGMATPAADLAALREALLVDSPEVQAHPVPSTFSLVPEQPAGHCIRGDLVTIAGPNVVPLEAAVRIPAAGRYRFTVTVGAPKEREKFIGTLRLGEFGKNETQTAPRNNDRFTQTATLNLDLGVHLIQLLYGPGWGDYWQDCWLKEMGVEKE